MAAMRPFILLLLVAAALAGNHHRHQHRHRRELHDWLTDEQKTALKDVPQGSAEFKQKIGVFYGQLPAEKRVEWDAFYKTRCFEWTAKVQTDAEETEFQKYVKENNLEKVKERVGELKEKLDEAGKKNLELWQDECFQLLKPKRMRREIEPAFKEFVKWMTPEQLGEVAELKKAGKESDVHAKVKEFFALLPADRQASLKEEFKGKCKVYFTPLMTPDEIEKIKTLKDDKAAAGALVKAVVDRQKGDVKKMAEKMLTVCGEVYKDASRKRREIAAAFQEFVKWMTPEQLGTVAELKKAGKETEAYAKVKEFFGLLPADRQATLKEEFKGKCRVYFTPLMKPEEVEKIKTLKDDKAAAGALVKAVVDRQEGDVKKMAEKMMFVCGEVYKDESRKRRETDPSFGNFASWMTPEQFTEITDLRAAGKESEAERRVDELFSKLPTDRQSLLMKEFKDMCKDYFNPLMTSEEIEQVESMKLDKKTVDMLMKNVVERQLPDIRSIAEKMFSLCGHDHRESGRNRREIEAAFQDFVKWMTPEQLGEVDALKTAGKSPADVQSKVKEFFSLLPAEKQATLKEEFKGKCRTYFTPLMTSEEIEKIKTLKADKEAAGALIKTVVDRQVGDVKAVSEKMLGVCGEVYKDSSRRRREIEPAFQDFVKWMTPEQLGVVAELKKAGKERELFAKVSEFFGLLPTDRQAALSEEFKGKCRTYFTPLMTSEETEKIKTLVGTGDKEAVGALVKKVVERQPEDVKKIAEKMFGVCGEVYKESKAKRDVASKIEKHLSWLQPGEKDEILKMSKEGKSKEDIKKRLLEIVEAKEKDAGEKEKTVKMCYAWMDEVATKEEIESLHKLHHVDHGACKRKVREFIGRLAEEKQQAVEASLPFCEKLWYGNHGDHEAHGDHGAHGDHSSHHHRRRRHLAVIEKYLEWMDESQKSAIKEIEASGAEFSVIADKIREFFGQLPADTQTELRDKFQHQCMIWAKEVSKPLEWEDIKRFHAAQDYAALKTKLVELEGRLTENQKHTIEHVRGVCYKLWGIKGVARRRRDSFHEKAAKYLDWLNEEQLGELKRLKEEGKKTEVMKAILKFFDAASGEQKAAAGGKLKEACREYSVKAFGAEKVAELKKLADQKADKAEMEKLADKYVEEIEDAEKKEFARSVVIGCKHVYSASRARRDLIASEVAEYLRN